MLRFFLDGLTLRQLVHMLIIFIGLIIIMPHTFKEWVNLHNPEIAPQYTMYYLLLLCFSFVINGAIANGTSSLITLIKNKHNQIKIDKIRALLMSTIDQLDVGEARLVAFAVDCDNKLCISRSNKDVISLVKKGILIRTGRSLIDPDRDNFKIASDHFDYCYAKFAGKSEIYE